MADRKKDGLGRALVRQHNQMLSQQKQKGVALRSQNRRVLVSYTETSDLEAVLENADESARVTDPTPTVKLTNPRPARDEREEALHASSLRVPRRPPWDSRMSPEEFDSNERDAFLKWRRSLARLEENDKLVLTPFEKNLDIWRQLWRVLERSHLLVMVVDGRDPLFYRCPDLEAYAKEIDEHKKTLLLINKADLLPVSVRKMWAEYFKSHGILFVFWSAKAASDTLDGKMTINQESFHPTDAEDIKIYSRDALLARLLAEAEAIKASSNEKEESTNNHSADSGRGASKHVVVGFVGYPNVGKSSTINALAGVKRTGVTSTPGKTKHFQTLIITDELILCDCPGLVFPSFSSSRYDMIACGVLPIDRMTENREAVQIVANHVPRNVLEEIYNISVPKPKTYEPKTRPPLASELLRAYCASRGYVASSGLPDETRAARQILKDYIDGKLPHFEMPPQVSDVETEVSIANGSPSSSTLSGHMSDSCGSDSDDLYPNKDSNAEKSNLENLLDDLDSFDMVTDLSSNAAAVKKKSSSAAMKHHKKPQRKKNRSWRVGNDGGDGMLVVRVFQKAPTPK